MSNKYYIVTHFSQGCIFFLLRIFTFLNMYAGFYSEESKGISLNIHKEKGNIDVTALHHFTPQKELWDFQHIYKGELVYRLQKCGT